MPVQKSGLPPQSYQKPLAQEPSDNGALFAEQTINRHGGDMQAVARAIWADAKNAHLMRQNDEAVRYQLKNMIHHSSDFKSHLGKSIGADTELSPVALAHIATLPITEIAEKALTQLETPRHPSMPSNPSSQATVARPLEEKFAHGLVCLARHIAEMPVDLLPRAATLVSSCVGNLPDQDKRDVYAACASLLPGKAGPLETLRAFGEAGARGLHHSAAAAADNKGRAMFAGRSTTSLPSRPAVSARQYAQQKFKACNDDAESVLDSIAARMQDPHTQRQSPSIEDELVAMVRHSSEFRIYLGIEDPSEASEEHATMWDEDTLAEHIPWALSIIATLSAKKLEAGRLWPETIDEQTAGRALQQLDEVLDDLEQQNSIDTDQGSWIESGYKSLVGKLDDMHESVADLACWHIMNKAMLLPPEQQENVLEACRKLPHSSSASVMIVREYGFENFLSTLPEKPDQPGAAEKTMRDPILSKIRPGGQPRNDSDFSDFNPTWKPIVDEARARGIGVRVLDTSGVFELSHEGRTILCAGTLPELTSERTCQLCMDKVLTSRYLEENGISVPPQQVAGNLEKDIAFLHEHGAVVVKPGVGGQGKGVSVDVRTEEELVKAIEHASALGRHVVIEKLWPGGDLRIMVTNYEVVTAVVRELPEVAGDGKATILDLIKQRNDQNTNKVPLDSETERCLKVQGLGYDSVLQPGQLVEVRKNANGVTGSIDRDVTAELHPELIGAAEKIARLLGNPMLGLDFNVKSPSLPDYAVIEANLSPGLGVPDMQKEVNHYLDFLFPGTSRITQQ